MPKPAERRACVIPGCKLSALDGSSRCADHQPRPATLRELIAAGPIWIPEAAKSSVKLTVCLACVDFVAAVDTATGLCRVCWRLWRFAQATTPVRVPLTG